MWQKIWRKQQRENQLKLLSYQNDVFERFGNKMKEMEEALVEKDALLKHIIEKVKHLEERQHCLIEKTC